MFNSYKREYKDPLLGLKYVADLDRQVTFLRRFDSFGASPTAKLLGQIEPYEFADEGTRARFLLLAAEALIVFGWSYDGFSQDEGFIRVDVDGRTLTLRDIAHP